MPAQRTKQTQFGIAGAVLGLVIGVIVGGIVGPIVELPMAIGVGAIAGINAATIAIETKLAGRHSWIWVIVGPAIGALMVAIARPINNVIAGICCGSLLGADVGIMIYGYVSQSLRHEEQRRMRHLAMFLAAALWLVGMGILYRFGGLSIFTFLFFSLMLAGCTVHIQKIKLWANLGWIAAGAYFIYMSYMERLRPLGMATWAADWWIAGVLLILVGVLWLVQHTMKLQP